MKPSARTRFTTALIAFGTLLATAQAQQNEQVTRMRTALAAAERPAEDKTRDEARKPVETIQFLGIATGATVVDIAAGGGWFTEVLSAAVGPGGKVLAQGLRDQARVARLGNVEVIQDVAAVNGQADAAITALNMHDLYNRGEEAAVTFASNAFKALKPGGVFGVIDHVGIAGQDNAALHRMQVESARTVLTKAGFTIEAESNVLANPADDHTKSVRDASLERHTDQFLIRARKPR